MADHDDVVTNVSSNPDIQSIIARRMVLKGGAGLAAVSLFGALSGCGSESNSLSTVPTIGLAALRARRRAEWPRLGSVQ